MNRIQWGIAGLVGLCLQVSEANAQQSPPRLNTGAAAQIQSQEQGNYPALSNRSALPLGAINNAWTNDCGQEDSTLVVAHSTTREIAFRVRQLMGSVVVFPEPVQVVSAPGGGGFTAEPYGANRAQASTTWVFGTTNAGVDSNYVFGGSSRHGVPTIYPIHVQAEGLNTENCPDMVVLIKPAVSKEMQRLAKMMHDWSNAAMATGQHVQSPQWSSATFDAASDDQEAEETTDDGSGRKEQDYLASFQTDPTKLVFDWEMYGEQSLLPDGVYSDCCRTYLYYKPERFPRVRFPAISAVERTANGLIDSPVVTNVRNTTIVVNGIQDLTLEREGFVGCIRGLDGVVEPHASTTSQFREDKEPVRNVDFQDERS